MPLLPSDKSKALEIAKNLATAYLESNEKPFGPSADVGKAVGDMYNEIYQKVLLSVSDSIEKS